MLAEQYGGRDTQNLLSKVSLLFYIGTNNNGRSGYLYVETT